ncbi:MAG: GNAT family N-acetyltransferase [Acidimicrobiales bacterium]
MEVTIEAFPWAGELARPDLAAINRIHNAAWAEWVPGDHPSSDAGFVDMDRFIAPPERMHRRLARTADGTVAGFAFAFWREGEPGGSTLRAFVDPQHRRQGVGRALGADLAATARAAERTGLTVEIAPSSPAEAAVRGAKGFSAGLVIELLRADVREVDRGLLEGWRAAGEAVPGYSLVAYDDRCPSDDLAGDFIAARAVMNDAPRPEGLAEQEFTLSELRGLEDASIAAHQSWWNVGVRHDESGALVGLTELYLPAKRPWMAFQGDTGVHPDHRGHGLGAWMKAVNHLRLADERPGVEWVQTWNAQSNEPMQRINRALGFEPKQHFQAWYTPLAPLP